MEAVRAARAWMVLMAGRVGGHRLLCVAGSSVKAAKAFGAVRPAVLGKGTSDRRRHVHPTLRDGSPSDETHSPR